MNYRSQSLLATRIFAFLACLGMLEIGHSALSAKPLYFKNAQLGMEAASAFEKSGITLELLQDNFFVIQYQSEITRDDQEAITRFGGTILHYVPDDALAVKMDPSNIALLKDNNSNKNIARILPYFDQWKMSPDFTPTNIFNQPEEIQLSIRFFEEIDEVQLAQIASLVAPQNLIYAKGKIVGVRTTRSRIGDLVKIAGVQWVQPIAKMEVASIDLSDEEAPTDATTLGTCDQLTGWESGTRVMNFESVWSRGITGKGQIVTVGDTGLDTGDVATLHQDFKSNFLKGYIFGWGAKSWGDPQGHGTHVSGSVLGNGNACQGRVKGGANEAQLIIQGIWSEAADTLTVPNQLKDLFDPSYKDGSRIHTNSWGASARPGIYDESSSQVDEFMWEHQDFLLVFAAGNSGVDKNQDGRIDPNSLGTPATAKNALTVGASENFTTGGIQRKLGDLRGGAENWGVEPLKSDTLSNNANGIAAFSSRGPTRDGRTKPDVVAPGTNILSNASQAPGASKMWGEFNKDYVYSGGTSMSTPLVAGAAALVRQNLIGLGHQQPSAALIKAVLMHTATDLYPGQYGEIGQAKGQEIITARPNSDEGFGRVDVNNATTLNDIHLFDAKEGVAQGANVDFSVSVPSGSLEITLVYTDAPAAPNVEKALVNNLDLTVVSPDGKVIGTGADVVNNSEYIKLKDLPAGSYQVSVKGARIAQGINGKQPFAMIVTAQ